MLLKLSLLLLCYEVGLSLADCEPQKCPQQDGPQLTMLPVPWDCRQYIMCQWGIPYYRPCGYGLHYDSERTVCVPSQLANCVPCDMNEQRENSEENISIMESRAEDVPPAETPGPADGISERCIKNSKTPVTCQEQMPDDRLMPHPDDCGLFYYCVDYTTPVCRDCPGDLHFNPTKKVCDRPDAAGCQAPPPAPRSLSNNTCEANPSQGPETPADLRPDPADCARYYVCDWGNLIPMTCPDGQHFSPTLKVCDHPDHAECEASVNT